MKKQSTTPAYGWENPAVLAALAGKGHLWLSIKDHELHLTGWYPPRVARFILLHLINAGRVEADAPKANRVEVAGQGDRRGNYLGHFEREKLAALLWGLSAYHKSLRRAARREAARQHQRANDAGMLGILSGYAPPRKCKKGFLLPL